MPAGSVLLSEIREQPVALARLLSATGDVTGAARALAARSPSVVRLVAHGSSDNAACYGVYVFGLLAGCTAFRDSISLPVYENVELDMATSAVIALSQSGMTPDVVAYVERARRAGALTIAITNEVGSDLASASELVIPLAAGPENSVAATKTYVNELAVLALLAASTVGRATEMKEALAAVPEIIDETAQADLSRLAEQLAESSHMFVIGRGVELATARETALKITELAGLAAQPYSATDLVHGPLAALGPSLPVWAVVADDGCLAAVRAATTRIRTTGSPLISCGAAAERIEGANHYVPVRSTTAPFLSPLVSIVPGQLIAFYLALARARDPDQPQFIAKVTTTP